MDDAIIPQKHYGITRFLFSRPIEPIPEEREHNYQDDHPYSRILWSWIFPTLKRGYDRVILPEDISYVSERDAMKHRFGDYQEYLRRHPPTPDTHYREFWAVLYAMRWRLILAFGLKLAAIGCEIGMSLITRKLIEEAELLTEVNGNRSHGPAVGYTLGMCVLDILSIITDLESLYIGIMNSELTRTLIMACIHDKMLRLGPQQRYDFSAGKIMTLSSSDSRRSCMALIEINSVLVLPAYFGATCGVLIYLMGVPGLPGIGLLLIGLIICSSMSYWVAALRMKSMPYQDQRISLTRETLKNITIIKFYAWEESFTKLIKRFRAVETKFIRLIELVDAFNIAMAIAAPNLAGALSFAVKIITSSTLNPAAAFPALSLFQMFQPILAQTSFAFMSLADAVVAVRRLDAFHRLPEVPSYIETMPETKETEGLICRILNGRFSWFVVEDAAEAGDEDDGGEFEALVPLSERKELKVLDNINLEIPRGTVTLVVGTVGSGKTSLLSAFVNTIPKSSGNVEIARGTRISSVLSLWSQSATVRENILFGLDYDAKRYQRVIEICDLQSDFSMFGSGDLTELGENGVTLSGGQRARLALARCLYADGDLIILDDVLSAMDSRVGNHVYRELIALAHNYGKSILFSTNNLKFVKDADYVIALDNKGSAEMMKSSAFKLDSSALAPTLDDEIPPTNESALNTIDLEKEMREKEMEVAKAHAQSSQKLQMDSIVAFGNAGAVEGTGIVAADLMDSKKHQHDLENVHPNFDTHGPNETQDLEKDGGMVTMSQMDMENRAIGTVSAMVLVRYFRLNTVPGFLLFFFMLLTLLCYACSSAMVNVVLNWWTSDYFHKSQGFNLGMYCLIVSLVGVFYALFSNFMSFLATASSTTLHNNAISGLYRSPASFFQKNPLGRLMMRFTEDMVNLDTRLLAFARMAFMTFFSMLASVIVIFVYVPWSLVCLIPIFFLSTVLLAYYRTTSREINRCQQLFDSRGMSSVSEHIEGQEVIVAFDKIESSQLRLNSRLDDVISACTYNEASNFWMAIRSGFLCEIISLVTIFLAIFQVFNLNASEVGLLISILPTVRMSLIMLFPMYSLFDNQLNSVERLDEYAEDLPIEGEAMKSKMKLELSEWQPTAGEIVFEDACLRYREDLPLVLNKFSLTFPGGQKIGICGRTGAGKSTIIAALFRLNELSSGKISIDGQDISEMPLEALRRALSIIPQSPVLFQGTIRSNLDPFGECDDSRVIESLKLAGLFGSDEDSKFTLKSEVQAEGSNFSLGERQMLALARAILKEAKILVLDEATAAVDHGTDERIQRTIKSVFADRTILCIAHRLETILDYDKILVMGPGGKLLEFGAPQELWNKNGVFRTMCDEAEVGF